MSQNAPQFMTLEALRSVPLFASLDDSAAIALRDLVKARRVPAGTNLFYMGDVGDAMYLIESGRVRIHMSDDDGDDMTLVELADGDFFGEMAMLDGKPRSAHATVVEDADLGTISRKDFLVFVRANPDVALKMLSAITDRLRHTDELLRTRVSRNLNDVEKERRTLADRVAELLSNFGGSWKFLLATIVFVAVWVLYNSWWRQNQGLDPFPYSFLDVINGVIGALLAPIILISQNMQENKDRLRADLDYQVNLKNELAIGEVMRRMDLLESERLPLLFAEQNQRIREAVGGAQ
jgi:CRP/FNR family cyclic AMP-dependent transcriptional regulator